MKSVEAASQPASTQFQQQSAAISYNQLHNNINKKCLLAFPDQNPFVKRYREDEEWQTESGCWIRRVTIPYRIPVHSIHRLETFLYLFLTSHFDIFSIKYNFFLHFIFFKFLGSHFFTYYLDKRINYT